MHKLKLLNDPIYGFITIPNPLIFDIIAHPYFQRLRRISQTGMSYLVYSGAHHTRFHHALGCLYLMQKAVRVLRYKTVEITPEEEQALYLAILLHDVGHGPFSHAMEHSIVENITHETLSLHFMEKLNTEFNQSLTLAISIFKGAYHKPFLCELISSQLDIDRLDYLKRDSFYTGVAEGNINSDRLITMLNVVNGHLVVEEKGIYSIEKFLMARRFMYWQVYLHKTSLVAEQLLIRVLQRAKVLLKSDIAISASDALMYFIKHNISKENFTKEALQYFSQLDDYDVVSALKTWQHHNDFVLSELSKMIINRQLLKIKVKSKPISETVFLKKIEDTKKRFNLTKNEVTYFVFKGEISNQAYQQSTQQIQILKPNGKVQDITKVSDQLNLKALVKPVVKYYICFPK